MKVNHEERWDSIRTIGLTATAEKFGVTKGALRHTVNKYKEWYPDLPFEGGIETPEKKKRKKAVSVPKTSEITEDLPVSEPEVSVDKQTGEIEVITRITQKEFDSRFYHSNIRLNARTGKNYFPSFSFISTLGSPASPQLAQWYRDKGHYAEVIFDERSRSGSALHDYIDRIISKCEPVSEAEIDDKWPQFATEIKDGLLGFINFWNDHKPKVIASEHMIIGDDVAGTVDCKARISDDNYEKIWTLDWKSSKVVNDKHKMQVAVYSEIEGTDECGVIVLGNKTQKKYTFTKVTPKDRKSLLAEWRCIKDLAYLKLIDDNFVEPKEHPFPPVFNIERYE